MAMVAGTGLGAPDGAQKTGWRSMGRTRWDRVLAHAAIDLSSRFGMAAFPCWTSRPRCLDGALQFELRISANSCQNPRDDFADTTGSEQATFGWQTKSRSW
jgi:hypothetical protein